MLHDLVWARETRPKWTMRGKLTPGCHLDVAQYAISNLEWVRFPYAVGVLLLIVLEMFEPVLRDTPFCMHSGEEVGR